MPVCDVAIVPEDYDKDEPDDTVPRGPDVRGELWIKGPNVVRGYWHRPEETASTFTKGWLHTGDVARLDEDGFIYIVDRAKDMIIRGGENVYSVEVEAALFEHPAVADVRRHRRPPPDARRGGRRRRRAPARVRRSRPTSWPTTWRHASPASWCPTHVWFRSEPLPRNPAGKVLKRELRDEVVDSAG